MINEIVERRNLNDAYLRVYGNKGSAGIDNIDVNQLGSHLRDYGSVYIEQIRSGTYQVNPILGVEIPKDNGKKRLLGIPTVVDRVIQQSIVQVLQPIFDER